jgi:hypothetical protein
MEEQARPVVDAAAVETKVSRIIAAVGAILAAVPATLISFGVLNWTGEQVAQYTLMLGLIVGLANVFAGQQTKANAIAVEAQVTPIANPQLTQVVPLVASEPQA